MKRYRNALRGLQISTLFAACALAICLGRDSPVGAQQEVAVYCSVCDQTFFSATHDCPGMTPPQRADESGDWTVQPSIETAEQRNIRLSHAANNDGVACHDKDDIHGAMRHYRRALQLWSGNSTASNNLRNSLRNYSIDANNAGVALSRYGDQEGAIRFYQLALQYWPDNTTASNNISIAQDNLNTQRGHAEDERKREETKRLLRESEEKIDGILNRAKGEFDTNAAGSKRPPIGDSGLKFADSLAGDNAGHNDASVVDLRDKTSDVVDPRIVRGKELKASAKVKTIVLLDALEAGQGDWDKSVDWLKKRIIKDPSNSGARDAYQFVLGLSAGLDERTPVAPLDDIDLPDLPGSNWTYSKAGAHEIVMRALAAVSAEDFLEAHHQFSRAHNKEPHHLGIRDCMNWSEGMVAASQSEPEDPFLDPALQEMLSEQLATDPKELERQQQSKSLLDYVRQTKGREPNLP